MKRYYWLLAAVLLLVASACKKQQEIVIAVNSVTVSPASLTLPIGGTSQLSATVEPSNAADKTISWSSSPSDVAIVDGNGLVAGLKVGTATITAKAGGKQGTCTVTVVSNSDYVPVTKITFDKTSLTLTEGDTYTIVATLDPKDASIGKPAWTSSNSDVAVVDADGKVVALKAGTTKVTASADGVSASCDVTVEAKYIPVILLSLDKTELSMIEGETETINATVEPEDATNRNVVWSSSDASVASVANGVVTAVAPGTAVITATAGEKSAECPVAVFPVHEYVDLGLSVFWATCNLGAAVSEEYGNRYAWGETEPNKEKYEWSNYKWCDSGQSNNLTKYNTSNSYGGMVDHKTVLDPEDDAATVSFGPQWRTPTREEWNELRTKCTWSSAKQNGIDGYRVSSNINDNSIFIPYTSSSTLIDNRWYYYHYWASTLYSTPRYAWISAGTSESYTDRSDGYFIRPIMSRGYVAVQSIELDKASIETFVGREVTLTATVTPYYATNNIVLWTSSNTAVATVHDGIVTALSDGTTEITASAEEKQISCTVKVLKPNDPVVVDLGLSVKWASFNVGAYYPEEFGDRFAWGEIEPNKEKYEWSNYKWGTSNNLSKYNTNNNYGSVVDGKTTLDPADDAASVIWGSSWRTPTKEEWQELRSQCDWISTTQKGISGYRVASKVNDNSIFIPSSSSSILIDNRWFYYRYWTSTLSSTPTNAWATNLPWEESSDNRIEGYFIRPVCE